MSGARVAEGLWPSAPTAAWPCGHADSKSRGRSGAPLRRMVRKAWHGNEAALSVDALRWGALRAPGTVGHSAGRPLAGGGKAAAGWLLATIAGMTGKRPRLFRLRPRKAGALAG